MKRLALLVLIAQVTLAQVNSIEIRKSAPKSTAIDIRFQATLESVAAALAPHVGRRVDFLVDERVVIRYARTGVDPVEALREIVTKSGYQLRETESGFEIRDPDEPAVDLDVHDADVRAILGIMKQQCGVTNLVVDPDVTGKGSFLLRDVPCGAAFRTVLTSMGLEGEWQPNSVLIVGVRR